MGPVAIGRAEAAWLRGEQAAIADAIAPVLSAAIATPQPWVTDEILFWQWRSGGSLGAEVAAVPFRRHVEGDWRGAAEVWRELGCPYEEACALADGDQDAAQAALAIFDALGALPAAAQLRAKLRELGVQHVSRGPRPSTQRHPAGLTNRQQQVLELLVDELTNAEIAARLFVAPKTVEHHVSAILSKLGAASRTEAAALAADLGLARNPK